MNSKKVRDGYVLSPQIFNVYSKLILQDALWEKNDDGVRNGGSITNNIRFGDAITAENVEDLHILIEIINRESKKRTLTMNIDKSKYVVISKIPVDIIHLALDGKPLERVENKYKYLGAIINSQLDQDEEI
ncbi:uncharacterized protein [Diabrotica undecimpunctata]|uniref:uncharacterized protein n=1 Tax=Diabrotica undecimpunctata TaxID=50387 RepID=UPI003B63F986